MFAVSHKRYVALALSTLTLNTWAMADINNDAGAFVKTYLHTQKPPSLKGNSSFFGAVSIAAPTQTSVKAIDCDTLVLSVVRKTSENQTSTWTYEIDIPVLKIRLESPYGANGGIYFHCAAGECITASTQAGQKASSEYAIIDLSGDVAFRLKRAFEDFQQSCVSPQSKP